MAQISDSTSANGTDVSPSQDLMSGSLNVASQGPFDYYNSSVVSNDFVFPPHYSFPPFFTLQPNQATRQSQLESWSSLVLSYCSHYHLFKLTTSHPLFQNKKLNRRLASADAKVVLGALIAADRAEWTSSTDTAAATRSWLGSSNQQQQTSSEEAFIFWKTKDEWFSEIADWITETGQKGSIFTVFELIEGDSSNKKSWQNMPRDMMIRILNVAMKRNKAVVFGEGDEMGVKFV